MDREDFKAAVKDAHALLAGVAAVIPKHVSPELLAYLERLDADPVGLDVLRNVLAAKATPPK